MYKLFIEKIVNIKKKNNLLLQHGPDGNFKKTTIGANLKVSCLAPLIHNEGKTVFSLTCLPDFSYDINDATKCRRKLLKENVSQVFQIIKN